MEVKKIITADNWTFSSYKSSDLQAFIHLGAEPSIEENQEPTVIYLITVLKNLEEEIFQLEFSELTDAIMAINERYGHWDYLERSQASSGGCGSCEAH